ncbi:MAG TPA: hypothetical protein VGJ02_04025 [Pyrinomonadaceae bacterium]|jgi:hypothetical protein
MKKHYLLAVSASIILGSALLVSAQPEVIIHHKVNPHSQSENKTAAAPATGGTSALSALTYHGGPLIDTPTIYLIWYGNWNQNNGTDTPAGQDLIRYWASNIGGSPYFQINTNNSINGKNISGTAFYGGEYTNTGTKTRLRDSDIQSIVSSSIGTSGGKLRYEADGVYFVITSSNVNEQSGFCTQYCGWHTAGNVTAGHVRYAFIGNAARCLSACAAQTKSPNGNAGVDAAISVMSHELEEATTDPDLNAWYDSRGAENADKCAWTFGHHQYPAANGSFANVRLGAKDFLIQRNLDLIGTSWFCLMSDDINNN